MLFGFDLGDWTFTKKGVPFTIDSDLDYITLAMPDQSKKTCIVCQMFRDLSNEGLTPKLSYHSVTPSTDPSGAIVANRWDVAIKKTAAFIPAAMADDKAIDTIGIWELGAVFKGDLDSLPLTSGMLVAECETTPGSDPSQVILKPSMMKMLLRVSVTVPPGKAVQLL